jgi:2-polyprenyl-3-methyl-5-hydroxy-6-metoxy-1,4-benzoquinol methylase
VPEIIDIVKNQKPSPHKVLDLGCGNGVLCGVLNKNGVDVVGIDHDDNGIAIAKSKHPNIPFYRYGVQDAPQKLLDDVGEGFDLVVSTEVIEHLYSPQMLINFANHCLNENGKLVITTPYHGYLKNLLLSIFNKWDFHHTVSWEGGHIKFWSRKTLTAFLSEHGFEVIAFSGVGRLPFLWKSMVLVAKKKTVNDVS